MRPSWPTRADALAVVGLCGFGLAQPLFDQLARAPAFFHVGRYELADVVLMVVVLTVLVPGLLIGVEAAAGIAGPRVRRGVHAVLVTVLGATTALPILVRHLPGPTPVLLGTAGILGAALAVAMRRWAGVRELLAWLAAAMPIFAAVFLLRSPVTPPVLPAAPAPGTARPVPVVLLVFDEFSLTALLDEHGAIDAQRFPHFAALAREATWFRNATTVASLSEAAVGAIVSGQYHSMKELDWTALRSHNVFTLLAPSHDLHVVESYVPFCPARLCVPPEPGGSVWTRAGSLLRDVGVVFLHLVAPPALRERLPEPSAPMLLLGPSLAADDEGFNAKQALAAARYELTARGLLERRRVFEAFIAGIRPTRRPTLHFLHILLPHDPSAYLPSGRACPAIPYYTPQRLSVDPLVTALAYYRHLGQVQFVDRMVGQLVVRLKEAGLWDDVLLIVVADHGVAFRPGADRRALESETMCDILAVPLFVKFPGQQGGGVTDRNVEIVDILPTVADVVGMAPPWSVDGRSLRDRRARPHKTVTGPGWLLERRLFRGQTRLVRAPRLPLACLDLAAKRELIGTDDAGDLVFRFGPYAGLLGRPVASLGRLAPTGIHATIDQPGRFTAVDPDAPIVPCAVAGQLLPADETTEGQAVAIAVNGTIRALTRASGAGADRGRFLAYLPERALAAGANTVEVLLVSGPPEAPLLARAPLADHQAWVLREDGAESALEASDGTRVRVVPGRIAGELSLLVARNDELSISGWAADMERREPAAAVLVFVDGRFVDQTTRFAPRHVVALLHRDKRLLETGFDVHLPLRDATDIARRVRVFALSRAGEASEVAAATGGTPSRGGGSRG